MLKVALLGNQLLQPRHSRIDICQRRCDGTLLFTVTRNWDGNLAYIAEINLLWSGVCQRSLFNICNKRTRFSVGIDEFR